MGACAGGGATKPCGCLFGSTGLGEGCVTTTVSTTVAVAVSTTVAVFVTVVLGSFFRVVVGLEVVVLDVVTALVVLVGAVFVVVETIAARVLLGSSGGSAFPAPPKTIAAEVTPTIPQWRFMRVPALALRSWRKNHAPGSMRPMPIIIKPTLREVRAASRVRPPKAMAVMARIFFNRLLLCAVFCCVCPIAPISKSEKVTCDVGRGEHNKSMNKI